MEHTLEITHGYLLTEGKLTGELTLDDGTGPWGSNFPKTVKIWR